MRRQVVTLAVFAAAVAVAKPDTAMADSSGPSVGAAYFAGTSNVAGAVHLQLFKGQSDRDYYWSSNQTGTDNFIRYAMEVDTTSASIGDRYFQAGLYEDYHGDPNANTTTGSCNPEISPCSPTNVERYAFEAWTDVSGEYHLDLLDDYGDGKSAISQVRIYADAVGNGAWRPQMVQQTYNSATGQFQDTSVAHFHDITVGNDTAYGLFAFTAATSYMDTSNRPGANLQGADHYGSLGVTLQGDSPGLIRPVVGPSNNGPIYAGTTAADCSAHGQNLYFQDSSTSSGENYDMKFYHN